MPAKWYADSANLALLLEYLHEQGDDFAACMYALRKPWKYEAEYLRACADVGVRS